MSNQPLPSDVGTPSWRLTERLLAKLDELEAQGLQVQWIEASFEDLTRLVLEGGDAAVRLDPDPALDRAWFGKAEIRHNSQTPGVWVFVRGDVAAGAISAHEVKPPE